MCGVCVCVCGWVGEACATCTLYVYEDRAHFIRSIRIEGNRASDDSSTYVDRLSAGTFPGLTWAFPKIRGPNVDPNHQGSSCKDTTENTKNL